MAISGISGYTPATVQQHANAQRTQSVQAAKQDADGDNDGSRAGEVERNESGRNVAPGATLGTLVNVRV